MNSKDIQKGNFIVGMMCFFMACLITLLISLNASLFYLHKNYRATYQTTSKTQEKLIHGLYGAYGDCIVNIVYLLGKYEKELQLGQEQVGGKDRPEPEGHSKGFKKVGHKGSSRP